MNRYWHLPLALVGLWAALLLVLNARSPIRWPEVRGWYAEQGDPIPYHWTSDRLVVPIRRSTVPIDVDLALAGPRWPGRLPPRVTLLADTQLLAAFDAPELPSSYHVVLPPGTAALVLRSTAERPPFGDARYLGVQVIALRAQARGLSSRLVTEALVAMALIGLATMALSWCLMRGVGTPAMLFVLALALRVLWLGQAPPGFRPDETVRLVDAASLLATARDHLGHFMPLGAQESLGNWAAPLLTYLELPAVALLGPVPIAGRFTVALFGALVAPLCYAVARRLQLPQPAAGLAGFAAAVSPWQIAISRLALPPALAAAGWTLVLLAALWLVQRGNRRAAFGLALAAGVVLYADPALWLALPLLVGWAALLALLRHGRALLASVWPALVLLALIWLPFGYVALRNPAFGSSQAQSFVRADSTPAWLVAWWPAYRGLFGLEFYFAAGTGGRAAATLATGLLLVLGLGLLVWRMGFGARLMPEQPSARRATSIDGWLLAGALLIAPLPASLQLSSPSEFRPALLAPLLALLMGMGASVLCWAGARAVGARWRRPAQLGLVLVFGALLCWQSGVWLREYLLLSPPNVAAVNQDGLLEASARVAEYAPQFDQIWIDTSAISTPYVYLLAARVLSPAEAQAQLVVERQLGQPNRVSRVGKFRFMSLADAPRDLPLVEAVPNQFGQPGFVLQHWDRAGLRLLILRRM